MSVAEEFATKIVTQFQEMSSPRNVLTRQGATKLWNIAVAVLDPLAKELEQAKAAAGKTVLELEVELSQLKKETAQRRNFAALGLALYQACQDFQDPPINADVPRDQQIDNLLTIYQKQGRTLQERDDQLLELQRQLELALTTTGVRKNPVTGEWECPFCGRSADTADTIRHHFHCAYRAHQLAKLGLEESL